MVRSRTRTPSAWFAEHRKDWRRRSHLYSAQQLEPVPFIERDVLRVTGFEISQRAVPIARDKSVFHQRRAESFALLNRIDPDERQEPVRLVRMIAAHLLEHCKSILLNWCVPSLLQQIG